MTRKSFDPSVLFLIAIIALVGGVVLAFGIGMRRDAVREALENDRVVNTAFILEELGKPVSTNVFFYYPANQRGAVLYVPSETGLIIKRIERLARLEEIYESAAPDAFVGEIAQLAGTDIPYWVAFDERSFTELVDLLDGIDVFMPNAVDLEASGRRIALPAGSQRLDGAKAWDYATYLDPDESDADLVDRRQKAFQALIRRLGERSAHISADPLFDAVRARMRSNIDEVALRRLLSLIGGFDANLLVTQRIPGVWKVIDGQRMLFPHYDGRIVVDIVRQTLNALARAGSFSVEDKIYVIDILNGTNERGLASKTAEMFQSFGYEVRNVANADSDDLARTVIQDHFGNPEGAVSIGDVIRCTNVETIAGGELLSDSLADFTIVLGKDFNGRYVVD
ncbi:MAG: LCP family protein [Spirochaetales bacterium]|nr:LCP family protein [Spirochaetales bacterium]